MNHSTEELEDEPDTDAEPQGIDAESSGEAAADPFADVPAGITEAQLSEAERKHYEAIKRANIEVANAQSVYDRANSAAKAAKKELELAGLELSTLISDGPQVPSPQMELPFGDPDSVDGPAADQDAWKETPICDVLKLTASQREKLEAAGISTLGRFEFVRAGSDPDFPRGLQSIKGFGEKTIDAMENDVVEWLSKNVREPESDE